MVIVTGVCECTSILGPGLGGGHGLLQGSHGLVSDQFISMRIVLADGSIKTVSANENSDLWWAVRGAGHNFGVVTSVTSKIYDAEVNWAYKSYTFTHDKVEAVYTAANNILENFSKKNAQVAWVYSLYIRIPDVDAVHVSCAFFFASTHLKARTK
jgi:FAD/FMN-containing dehydrogenase